MNRSGNFFFKAYAAVSANGAFLIADLVKGPTPAAESRYGQWWENAAYKAGATQQEWGQAQSRRRYDQPATLADQLRWLDKAGFHEVDCWFKCYPFAIFGGFR